MITVDLNTNTFKCPEGVLQLSPIQAEVVYTLAESNQPIPLMKLMDRIYGNVENVPTDEGFRSHCISRTRIRLSKLGYTISHSKKHGYALESSKNVRPLNPKYTEDEDRFLIDNYGKMKTAEIANRLGCRSRGSINQRAFRLGITAQRCETVPTQSK